MIVVDCYRFCTCFIEYKENVEFGVNNKQSYIDLLAFPEFERITSC